MTIAGKVTHLLAGLMLLGLGFAQAAGIEHSLDVPQAFNFKKDVPSPVGYLGSLTIGGRALAADIRVTRPDGTTANVVGVLGSVAWSAGATDPIALQAQVSTPNKEVIASMLRSQLRDNSVTFQFEVFEYDRVGKKWYQAFGSTRGTTLAGTVAKEGKTVKLALAPQPGAVRAPQNWGLALGVAPAPRSQSLLVATSSGATLAKRWGVEVAK